MRINLKRARRILSISVAAVLATPAVASARGPVTVENGAHIDIVDDSILSTAGSTPGVRALTSGTAALSNTDVSTTGNFAHGVVVNSASSRVDIEGGKISTQGRESYGLYTDAGTIRASNVEINSSGLGSIGILARGGNSSVDLSDARVVANDSGHAAAATGGAQLHLARAHLTAGEKSGNGLTARDANTHVSVVDSQIEARGADSHGVLITGQATVEVKDSHISATGDRSRGVWASGRGSVLIENSRISTFGDRTVDGAGNPFGPAAIVASQGAAISLTDTDMSTTGYAAGGINAEGSGSIITMTGGTIHTLGDASRGATAHGGNSRVDLAGVRVLSEGASGQGVAAGDAGSQLSMLDSIVETRGSEGTGIYARDFGIVSIARSRVSTLGDDAPGADIRSGAQLLMYGSELHSATSTAALLDRATVVADGASSIVGGNGKLAELSSDAVSTILFDNASAGLGDIRFASGALDADGNGSLDRTSSLSLDNNSYWMGATDAIGDLSLANGSRWDVTGSSEIGSLSLADSSVVFDHSDGQYKTLTVDGNFHAVNGLLVMNTALGDDASPTDVLHIKGDTSGNANIAVNNVGGTGAQTEDGIKLVQVDGVSAGKYALAGRAVGGAYEYFLYQGGHSDPNDGDWYLRSELSKVDPPIVPPVDPCVGTDCPVDPVIDLPRQTPVFRPEAGAYLANQASALGLFNMDLHERVGEPNLAQRQRGDGNLGSAWARVTTEQPRYRINDQLSGQGRHNVVQIGSDLTFWGKQDRGVVGVMAGSGHATNRVISSLTGYGAEGRVEGKSLGVYNTWIQDAEDDDGLYIDGWLQAAQFKNRVQGDALAREQYRSRSLSASLEAGYALRLRQNETNALYLEPQVQAIWTDYRMDGGQHQEVNGTAVKTAEAGGLQTRVGARLYGHSTAASGNRVQPFMGVNWIRNGSDANAVWMGEQRLQGIVPKNVYEAKAGAQLQLSPKLTGWGELSVQKGDYGFRSVGGQLGVKYAW